MTNAPEKIVHSCTKKIRHETTESAQNHIDRLFKLGENAHECYQIYKCEICEGFHIARGDSNSHKELFEKCKEESRRSRDNLATQLRNSKNPENLLVAEILDSLTFNSCKAGTTTPVVRITSAYRICSAAMLLSQGMINTLNAERLGYVVKNMAEKIGSGLGKSKNL